MRPHDGITPDQMLEIGKAAEHLVCADLILKGYRAFLSDQGLPYDVIVDLGDRMLRLQVKATCRAKNVNQDGRRERVAYSWNIRRRGREGAARLNEHDCDIVALVALDIRTVAYVPLHRCAMTMQLPPPRTSFSTMMRKSGQWARPIDQWPFRMALADDDGFYEASKRHLTHCMKGHEFTPENTKIRSNGSRACIACTRERSLARSRSRRAAA